MRLRMMRLCCLLILYLLHFGLAQAQTPPKFRHLTTAEGLPSNSISAIFEDKTGFLWIGTDAGLARYDGRNMQVFQHDPNNENSIAGNNIFQITQDGKGNIWAMSVRHLNRYNPVLKQWKRYPLPYEYPVSAAIHPLFADSEGNIWWVKDSKGIYEDGAEIAYQSYRIKTDSIQTYTLRFQSNRKAGTQPDRYFFHNLFEYKGEVYGAGGFIKYDKARDCLVQVHQGEGLPAGGRLSVMTHDEQGIVYYFGGDLGDSTMRYDLHTQKVQLTTLPKHLKNTRTLSLKDAPYLLPISTPFCALYDRETHTIWVGSYAGLEEINLRAQKHINHTSNPFDNTTLRNDRIVALYKDSKGNIWVGTENGLSYFPSRPLFYHEYPRSVTGKATLSNRDILSITEDAERNIWMGTKNKISVWNRAANDYTTVALPIPQDKQVGNMIETRSIVHQNNRAYAATWGAGLYEINPKSKQAAYLSLVTRNADPKDAEYVKALYKHCLPFLSHVKADEQGNIWSIDWGMGLDLACYNPRAQQFTRYPIHKDVANFPEPHDGIRGGLLMSLAISPDKIYVATQDRGVYLFDRQMRHFNNVLQHDSRDPNSLSSNNVKTVFFSRAGELWVGTENGLNRLKKDDTFERFQNFPNNYIAAIEDDDKDFLWVATQNGLCRLNPRTGDFTYYTYHHGLQSGGFNNNAIFKSSGGEIFVGGANGFNYFHPDSVIARQNKIAPRVVLTHLKVLNRDYVPQDSAIEFRKAINLASDENDLQFTFAALDLTAPNNNRYEYRLILKDNGWFNIGNKSDTSWVSMGNNNTLNLPRVGFGEYVLEVRASAAPGPWSSSADIARLYLTIRVPWYLNKYIVLPLLLLAGVGAVGYTNYRAKVKVRQLEADKQRLEEAVAARTKELQEANEELLMQKEEIERQAENLRESNERINALAADLQSKKVELEEKNIELEEKNATIYKIHKGLAHSVIHSSAVFEQLLKEARGRTNDPRAKDILEKFAMNMAMRGHLTSFFHYSEDALTKGRDEHEIQQLLTEMVHALRNIATFSGFRVKINIERLDKVQVNETQNRGIGRVLVELYHNAEKYLQTTNGEEPSISLAVVQSDDYWKLLYRDNGKGYPEAIVRQGATALTDLYRSCSDMRAVPHIYNDNGACFELTVQKSSLP